MRAVRRLALGRLISLMGGSAAYIALIASLYEQTGSAAWVSAALFAGVIGSVLGAPGAGYVGDRLDRRRVLIATDLASAAVAGAMALAIDEPAALVGLFGLLAVVTSPFAPASAAAMPNLVGADEEVARANALVAATTSVGYLLGPLAGGLLLGAGVSTPSLFVLDALSFLVSAAFVASIRRPFGTGGGTESHPGVLAGVRVIRREPVLRLLIAASMTSLLGIGIVNVAAYPLSLRLDGGTEGYGAMEALLGGGGLLGAALAGRLLTTGNATTVIGLSYAASAAGLALAGAAPVLLVALAAMAVAGGGRGLGEVADTTLIQARTEDAVRSRVFAAEEGAAHVAFSAAMLAGGVLVEASGARAAVGAAAFCGLVAALIAARMRTRA